MRLRICKRCGKTFETEKSDAYFCPKCSDEAHKLAPIRERVCRTCGITFWGFPRSFNCPDCQMERKKEQVKNHKRNGPARPLGSIDTCKKCGKEYVVNSGQQKYCKDCAEAAIKDNSRAHNREYNAKNRETLYAHKNEMRNNRNVCVICQKVFDADTPTVTCSEECASKLRKIRQAEADLRRGKRKIPYYEVKKSELPKSGITGVTARKNGKWQASYKQHYIGVFDTIEAAAAAIEEYKDKHPND